MRKQDVTITDHLKAIPSAVRPIVRMAREVVRTAAPDAEEVVYPSSRPRSRSSMWKLARYRLDGEDVVGLGTFSTHSSLFFYRGRDLHDDGELLKGSGEALRFVTLRSATDANSRAVKRLVRDAFELARTLTES